MSNRAIAVLATVAVLAGGTVAGIGLATRSGSKHTSRAPLVDESSGRIGRVVLGETGAGVVAALGSPLENGRHDPEVIRYKHIEVTVVRGRVTSITVDDEDARTLKAVGVGDPLGAVRAAYRKSATCVKLPEKESEDGTGSSSGYCDVTVPAGRLHFDHNPIETITLSRTG